MLSADTRGHETQSSLNILQDHRVVCSGLPLHELPKTGFLHQRLDKPVVRAKEQLPSPGCSQQLCLEMRWSKMNFTEVICFCVAAFCSHLFIGGSLLILMLNILLRWFGSFSSAAVCVGVILLF